VRKDLWKKDLNRMLMKGYREEGLKWDIGEKTW
jgi:hypothetical protein